MPIDPSADPLPASIIPKSFLPHLGEIAVRYSQMDHAVNLTIWGLANLDRNAGIAILSVVVNLGTKLQIFRNLVLTRCDNQHDQEKLLTIIEITNELVSKRNRLVHDQPYWYSPSEGAVGSFRAQSITTPPIKQHEPTIATTASLANLANAMLWVHVWLDMYRNNHPHWPDDAQFPWPDKLQQLRKSGHQNRAQNP